MDTPCAQCGRVLGQRSVGNLCAACYDLTEQFNSAKWKRAGPFLDELASGRISQADVDGGKVWYCDRCGDWGYYAQTPTHACDPER